MRVTSRIAAPCVLALLAAGCGEEAPERDFSRPPVYRHDAMEQILANRARKYEAKRQAEGKERERLRTVRKQEADAELKALPEGFPAAFRGSPSAEFEWGSAHPKITLVRLREPEGVAAAFERVKNAAAETGWILEAETSVDGQIQAAFFKAPQRAEVRIDHDGERGTRLVVSLQDLELPRPVGTTDPPAEASP